MSERKRLVVKIGSTLITNHGEGVDHAQIVDWVRQICELSQVGWQVVLVSSGAIAEGMKRLGWKQRPQEVNQLQAAAAVGQMGLVQVYESAFRARGRETAQVLLTNDDLADRKRYLNARSTLNTLLDLSVVPVINENDTVVTDEIRFGDNDTLAALVTNLIDANLLLILTDQQGLYTADPRKDPSATLIKLANAGAAELETMAGGTGSSLGRGGMLTKVLAAKKAALSGASTTIAYGRIEDVILRVTSSAEPEHAPGTHLRATTSPVQARKAWLAAHLNVEGRLTLDAGAVRALQAGGRSLLAVGVQAVQGRFERGDAVICLDPAGQEVARGLINYNASECGALRGKPSSEIEATLGYVAEPELIHCDNLILSA